MSTTPATLTRADIAVATGWSYTTIKRQERRLGLDRCRVRIGTRNVYYSARLVRRLAWWQDLFGQ